MNFFNLFLVTTVGSGRQAVMKSSEPANTLRAMLALRHRTTTESKGKGDIYKSHRVSQILQQRVNVRPVAALPPIPHSPQLSPLTMEGLLTAVRCVPPTQYQPRKEVHHVLIIARSPPPVHTTELLPRGPAPRPLAPMVFSTWSTRDGPQNFALGTSGPSKPTIVSSGVINHHVPSHSVGSRVPQESDTLLNPVRNSHVHNTEQKGPHANRGTSAMIQLLEARFESLPAVPQMETLLRVSGVLSAEPKKKKLFPVGPKMVSRRDVDYLDRCKSSDFFDRGSIELCAIGRGGPIPESPPRVVAHTSHNNIDS